MVGGSLFILLSGYGLFMTPPKLLFPLPPDQTACEATREGGEDDSVYITTRVKGELSVQITLYMNTSICVALDTRGIFCIKVSVFVLHSQSTVSSQYHCLSDSSLRNRLCL